MSSDDVTKSERRRRKTLGTGVHPAIELPDGVEPPSDFTDEPTDPGLRAKLKKYNALSEVAFNRRLKRGRAILGAIIGLVTAGGGVTLSLVRQADLDATNARVKVVEVATAEHSTAIDRIRDEVQLLREFAAGLIVRATPPKTKK